ncbi:hypothetical protein AB0N16_20040 [Streptomyces sp. NPDC051105]|uniref:hypothetical protein n=1 Tax=Streptomyces sp. NPDC051105 TaxID=3154843 RepID=UPI0034479F25
MPTTRMRAATLTIAAAATAAVFTSACSASHDDSTGGKSRQLVAQAMVLPDAKVRATWPKAQVDRGLAKGMRLPLQDYMMASSDVVDVENARDLVKQQCMQHLGLSFTPEPSGLNPASAYDAMNMKRRYGISDRTEAARLGFAAPQDPEDDTQSEDAELAKEDAESSVSGWDTAMNDTCIPEANNKVGVLFETDLSGDLASQSYEATSTRPAVKAALTSWSSCMKKHGYQVKSIDDAEGRFATPKLHGLKPARDEFAMATVDVDCKQAADLVPAWYQAESAYQKKQITSHLKELQAERAHNQRLVQKAHAVLAAAATR